MSIGLCASNANTKISGKSWDSRTAGIMLYGFGTKPHPDSICPDALDRTLDRVMDLLRDCLEEIGSGPGANDIRYASAKLSDAITEANQAVKEIRDFLGQGIYLGGAAVYLTNFAYCAALFGGASAYLWGNGSWVRINPNFFGPLITNALCGDVRYQPEMFQGGIPVGIKGILAISSTGIDPNKALACLRNDSSGQLCSTPAILLCKELEAQTGAPSTVLDLRLSEEGA